MAEGLEVEAGVENVLTGYDDFWPSPYEYDNEADLAESFRRYLLWEAGLTAQLDKEGDVGMRLL